MRDLFLIVLTIFALLFGYYLRSIFTPVLVAFALAYLFHPVIGYMQKQWNLKRPIAILIILGSILMAGLAVAAWIVPVFIEQLGKLTQVVTKAVRDHVADISPEKFNAIKDQLETWASRIEADPVSFFVDQFTLLFAGTSVGASMVTGVIGAATYIAITAILIPLYFFFIASQFDPLVDSFTNYIPASSRPRTLKVVGDMNEIVSTYFRSRVLISFIMGVLLSLGWAIVGVPFWFILGMAGGLLSLIPFASAAVWPIAIALVALQANQTGAAFNLMSVVILPSIVFCVVQAIEGWFLTPLLQGRSLNMSAMAILIVVFIGGSIGGLYGLILCIPVAACVKILASQVFLPRLREWSAEN